MNIHLVLHEGGAVHDPRPAGAAPDHVGFVGRLLHGEIAMEMAVAPHEADDDVGGVFRDYLRVNLIDVELKLAGVVSFAALSAAVDPRLFVIPGSVQVSQPIYLLSRLHDLRYLRCLHYHILVMGLSVVVHCCHF